MLVFCLCHVRCGEGEGEKKAVHLKLQLLLHNACVPPH
jgi:hypothetical protein